MMDLVMIRPVAVGRHCLFHRRLKALPGWVEGTGALGAYFYGLQRWGFSV